MKVLQIMPEFGLAGAETMCENLSYELVKQGHEIVIVSLYDYHSAITDRLENSGIRIVYLNKKSGLDLSILCKLRNVFKEEKPDVIHTHRYVMIYSVPASFFLGIKRVHTVHNVAEKEVSKAYRLLYKLFYKINKVTPVALSELIQNTIVEMYSLKPENVPIVFNGVPLEKCIQKKDYRIQGNFKIVNIARFNAQKNHVRLVNVFYTFLQSNIDAELWLIGDGDLKEKIQSLVIEKGIEDKVVFWGLKSDVYSYIHDADVFLLSSDYEGMPMTIIEAMGSGVPIISTNVGGIADMMENEKEGLLTSFDTFEIAEKLYRIYQSEELRTKLGTNALKKSYVFSAKEMAGKYSKIYNGEY